MKAAFFVVVVFLAMILSFSSVGAEEQILSVPLKVEGQKYVAKPGDTLATIAKDAGVPIEDILAANPQIKHENSIKAGQGIKIPSTDLTQTQIHVHVWPSSVDIPPVPIPESISALENLHKHLTAMHYGIQGWIWLLVGVVIFLLLPSLLTAFTIWKWRKKVAAIQPDGAKVVLKHQGLPLVDLSSKESIIRYAEQVSKTFPLDDHHPCLFCERAILVRKYVDHVITRCASPRNFVSRETKEEKARAKAQEQEAPSAA